MAKKTVSSRLPANLVKRIDKINNNRSNLIANALIEYIADPQMIDNHIKRKKKDKEDLIEEKHDIEKQIEDKREEIRDLEHLRTEMNTFQKVKEKIPEKEIDVTRNAVTKNKYDSDSRSLEVNQVLQHNAKRISDDYDIEKEKVLKVLRIATEV